MGAEQGLFYPDGSFLSDLDIRRKGLLERGTGATIISRSEFPPIRDFNAWSDIISRQQAERQELLGIPESIEVTIETSGPILVGLIGDVHGGGSDVNYDAFAHDVKLIKAAKGFTMTFGDLTDSYFFFPEAGEQLLAGDEQVLFLQSALEALSEDGRLIASWAGDHDMWAKDRSGAHTLYQNFQRQYQTHYLEGVSYVTINLFDGATTVPYRIVGAHQHKGFSVYNDSHASWRQQLDESNMSENVISITAHNHTKAHQRQVRKTFGGRERIIDAISLGTYKNSDRYSRKKGWARKGEESAGAFGLILYPGEEKVEVCWTIDEAVEKLSKHK